LFKIEPQFKVAYSRGVTILSDWTIVVPHILGFFGLIIPRFCSLREILLKNQIGMPFHVHREMETCPAQ
jgi:hypothetical protein